MQHIIGLLGAKGAGKDTAAKHLVDTQGYVRIAFADKLYAEVAVAFGVTVEFLGRRETKESPLAELRLGNCLDLAFIACVAEELAADSRSSAFLDLPRSPRVVLQLWGTEYRRKRGLDSYWLDVIAAALNGNPQQSFVLTDVRFPNEARFITQRGGRLVRVRRPELEAREAQNRAASGTSAHPSETALLSWPVDAEVHNPEGRPELLFQDIDGLTLATPSGRQAA